MGPHESESVAQTVERYALEALTWNWGEAYWITVTDGTWQARRRDRLGGPLEASTPEELRRAIWDDYSVRPVPREPDPGHEIRPEPGTVYSAGPRCAGRPADPGEESHYPLEAICAGCGEPVVLRQFLPIGPDGEWQHTGRKAGED